MTLCYQTSLFWFVVEIYLKFHLPQRSIELPLPKWYVINTNEHNVITKLHHANKMAMFIIDQWCKVQYSYILSSLKGPQSSKVKIYIYQSSLEYSENLKVNIKYLFLQHNHVHHEIMIYNIIILMFRGRWA